MAGELKQHEHDEHILIPDTRKRWPGSLLGCLSYDVNISDDQVAWPWVLLKACACPATVLGANETLFQGEELADVGCLQPHSCSGPLCRELNEVYCGLGNEGLKLCASTCLLQALCSCACLGLPFVAWWTLLQRQRVVAKFSVDDSDEANGLAAAMFPCSLLQMHVLLHQQRQAQQQQQEDASVPLRPPKVQRMTATASCSNCLIQAPVASSVPGPLTSGLSASKVLRTVRTHPGRSESLVLREQAASAAGSRPCNSPSCSSDTSDGVDSPYSARQAPDGISPDLRLSAAAAAAAAEGLAQYSSVRGASGAQPAAAAGSALSHSHPAHGEHSSSSSWLGQQQPGLSPNAGILQATAAAAAARQSVRRSSGVDDMPLGPLHQRQSSLFKKQAPQQAAASGSSKPGHARTMSAGAACGGSSGRAAAAAAAGRSCTSPELLCNIASCGGAVGGAAAISVSQSCQLPACHSSGSSVGAAPAAAEAWTAAAAGGASSSRGFACSSSLGRLQLSQEDAPLLAMKASPGRTTGPRGLPGPGLSSSRCAGLAGSWQQQQSSADTAELAAACRGDGGSDAAQDAAASQQHAACQPDRRNGASWLGSAGVSTSDVQLDAQQQHEQEQLPPLPVPEESGLLGALPAGRRSSSSGRGNDAAAASAGQHRTSERWAYTSELCNLGGSFEASSGLVAAMQRCSASGRSAGAGGSTDDCQDSDTNPLSSGSSSEAVHAPDAGRQTASAAPDAPRLAGSLHVGTVQPQQQPQQQSQVQPQQQSKSHHRAASGSWPDAAPSPYSTLTDASGSGPAPTQGSSKAAGSAQGAAVSGSSSGGGGSGDGSSRLALKGIDRQMLAAVTGCSSTERLTASQEELAAKLAKLAFANPAAARQLAGPKPQRTEQQQQQVKADAFAGTRASAAPAAAADEGCCDEPFYPTVMSDVCNLAEPVDGADRASIANLWAAASTAQRTSLLQSLSGRQPQHSGKRSLAGGAPATGRSAAGKLLPPLSSAGAAAGPLKSGLLLRSQQGSQQLPSGQLRAGAAAASSRASRPGMARLACGSAAAADGSVGGIGGGCSSGQGGTPESFDSYYPDCSLSRDFGPAVSSASGVDAASSSSAGGVSGRDSRISEAGHGRDKTYTVTPGGMIMETPGVRELAAAAAAGAKATGLQQLKKQQGLSGGGALPGSAIAVVTAAAVADGGVFVARASSGCREAACSSPAHEAACWQGVGSGRGSPPALVVGVRAAAHPLSAAGRPKGPAACSSVQTSSSLWPPPESRKPGHRIA